MSSNQKPTPPPGMTAGMVAEGHGLPPQSPPSGGHAGHGDHGGHVGHGERVAPPGALPPGVKLPPGAKLPPGVKASAPPKVNARPYIRRALKMLGKHKLLVALSVFFTAILSLAPFLVSAAFGPLIQTLGEAARDNRMNDVWSLTGSLYSKSDPDLNGFERWLATPLSFLTIFIVWAVALLLSEMMRFALSWVNAKLEQAVLTEVRQRVYDHLQTLSLDFFTGGQTGALMQRILAETVGVQRMLTQVLLTPLIDVIVLIIAFVYLLSLSWQMTIVSFILAPLAFLTFRYTGNKMQEVSMKMAMSGRELSGELNESISGMADIQVFNAQARRSARFNIASRQASANQASMIAWINLGNSSTQTFIAISTALVLLVGIIFGARFGLTLASLIVFVLFVPTMFLPVQRLIAAYTNYRSLSPQVIETYKLLDTKPSVAEKPGAREMGEVHGNVNFENVVFGYSPAQKVLNGISFQIREGETVAFVGPIGCGKSTIFNLLLRFLDPETGRVMVDGQDISDVTLNSLRTQVSKLSQFPFFLKDTIRENVRLGREGATDAEVEEACRTAHVHDIIVDPKRMPRGYDTVVDVQVPSGGQKRLIALARCLLRKPEVLLLDEPTENLDADQRNRLTQVIREYARERTCLVISHDMNFIAAVSDRIIVINNGRVADEGTHDELLAREGLYKSLYEMKNIDPALLRTRGAAGAPPAGGIPKGTVVHRTSA